MTDFKLDEERWSEELDDLSPRSKRLVIRELCGKGQFLDMEEPRFVEEKIKQLDTVLIRMTAEDKDAYLQACKLHPGLQSNKSLRLKFLRAEQFDAGLAAHRLTQYFDFMRQWFGEKLLGRTITLADLDEFDHQALGSGGIQVLSKKDDGGRRVLFYRAVDLQFKTSKNIVS
jgi:hypothetical protein